MTDPKYEGRDPSVNNRLAEALLLPHGARVVSIRCAGLDRYEVAYYDDGKLERRYISDGLPEILDHPAPLVSPA